MERSQFSDTSPYLLIFVKHGHQNDQFWGSAIAVLRMSNLSAVAGITHLPAIGYNYELVHLDSAGNSKIITSSDSPPASPFSQQFRVANNIWELRVSPISGSMDKLECDRQPNHFHDNRKPALGLTDIYDLQADTVTTDFTR